MKSNGTRPGPAARTAALALGTLALAVACGGTGDGAGDPARTAVPLDPAEIRKAEAIYEAQTCALCHGADANGGSDGPALRALGDWWNEDKLVRYLIDPEGFVDIHKDFDARRDVDYAMAMPAYDYVPREDLELLARWMLSRPAAGDDGAADAGADSER